MIGETVVVERQVAGAPDAHGNATVTWAAESVADVLVAPGPRTDIADPGRPDGTVVAWTLHFPKTYTGALRGARVRIRGGAACDVIGDPQPYTVENTPTRWVLPVEVKRGDG